MKSLNDKLTFTSGHQMKNRFMLAPLTNTQSHEDGVLSEAEITWLTRRAKDGFGVITTAASHVSEHGKGWNGEMGVWDDSHIPGLTKMATQLRENNSISLVQIFHGGMKAPSELNSRIPVCPSEMKDNEGKTVARELELSEISLFEISVQRLTGTIRSSEKPLKK